MRIVARSLLAVALVASLVGPVWAGGVDTTTLECGLFRDYTAPEPATSTPGSITFGVSGTPEVIAADATLVPPADTALPSLQGGAPTALTVIRNGGVITSLSFAPACTISGTPVLVPDLFGPGQDGYVIADRLFIPVEQLASNDGLAALIGTAADTGGTFSVTFDIDLSTGMPSGITAQTTLIGVVTMLDGGTFRSARRRFLRPSSTKRPALSWRRRLSWAWRPRWSSMASGPSTKRPAGR